MRGREWQKKRQRMRESIAAEQGDNDKPNKNLMRGMAWRETMAIKERRNHGRDCLADLRRSPCTLSGTQSHRRHFGLRRKWILQESGPGGRWVAPPPNPQNACFLQENLGSAKMVSKQWILDKWSHFCTKPAKNAQKNSGPLNGLHRPKNMQKIL